MDLAEFVRESLCEIADGIRGANVTTRLAASAEATGGAKLLVLSGDLAAKELDHSHVSRTRFTVQIMAALT